MECHIVRDIIHDYVLGTLDSGVTAALGEHLRHCRECAALHRETKRYYRAIKKTPLPAPPQDFIRQTMERIEQPRSRWRDVLEFLFYPLRVKIPMEAAGIILVSVLLFLVYRPDRMAEHPGFAPGIVSQDAETPTLQLKRERTAITTAEKAKGKTGKLRRKESEIVAADKSALEEMRDQDDAEALASETAAADMLALTITVHQPVAEGSIATESKAAMKFHSKAEKAYGGAPSSVEQQSLPSQGASPLKEIIGQNKGKILKSVNAKGAEIMEIEIPRGYYKALMTRLGALGTVKEKTEKQPGAKETISIDLKLK